MLGIVFTELMTMIENQFSADLLDDVIDDAGVSGAYTAVGNYPLIDLQRLIAALSKRSGFPMEALIQAYGEYLFDRFHQRYDELFVGINDSFQFLEQIDQHIHVQVKKLYPDAELPRFTANRVSPNELWLDYSSPRCLGHLAVGLMTGCASHFGEAVNIDATPNLEASQITFKLTRVFQ